VSETSDSGITVMDRDGNPHKYDADDWSKDQDGHLFITKGGKNVAIYAPGGYTGVYRSEHAR
jgi:hypothetical protein